MQVLTLSENKSCPFESYYLRLVSLTTSHEIVAVHITLLDVVATVCLKIILAYQGPPLHVCSYAEFFAIYRMYFKVLNTQEFVESVSNLVDISEFFVYVQYKQDRC